MTDKKEKIWFVYLLECNDSTYYCGVTNDIDRRMEVHAQGRGSKYVNSRGFRKLLRALPCKNKSSAFKKECEVKKLKRHEKLDYFDF